MDVWQFGLFLFVALGANIIECTDFHSLTVKDLQGNVVPMSVFKGKVSFFFFLRCVTVTTVGTMYKCLVQHSYL